MKALIGPAFLLLALGADHAGAQSTTRIRVALPGFGVQIVMDTLGEVREVSAPPGRVFTAAAMVMQNLRIPIDVRDSAGGLLGAAKLVRTRNLAGSALSRYLECGSGMTGPRADSHRVQMPLLLFIDAAPEGKTKLRIALAASAQDNSGTSNSPVTCGSTGALEGQLRRAIGAQLAVLP